jgi:hypothetical protein
MLPLAMAIAARQLTMRESAALGLDLQPNPPVGLTAVDNQGRGRLRPMPQRSRRLAGALFARASCARPWRVER